MYRRDAVELPPLLGWFLTLLRAVTFLGLLFVFLQPQWRTEAEVTHHSRVALLVDTSLSMGLNDSDSDPKGSAAAPSRIEQVAAGLAEDRALDSASQDPRRGRLSSSTTVWTATWCRWASCRGSPRRARMPAAPSAQGDPAPADKTGLAHGGGVAEVSHPGGHGDPAGRGPPTIAPPGARHAVGRRRAGERRRAERRRRSGRRRQAGLARSRSPSSPSASAPTRSRRTSASTTWRRRCGPIRATAIRSPATSRPRDWRDKR